MNASHIKRKPTKAIVFDFGRTIYDPETDKLVTGARELLDRARTNGYICILLTKASPERREQLEALNLTEAFDDIVITTQKSASIFQDFVVKFAIDINHSYVIGDRAQNELAFGAEAGWPTIWFRTGKFKDELPSAGQPPTHIVTSLDEAAELI